MNIQNSQYKKMCFRPLGSECMFQDNYHFRDDYTDYHNYNVSIEKKSSHVNIYKGARKIIGKNGSLYYSLPHNSEYRVVIHNNSSNKVNAILTIDGAKMGKWRVNPYSEIRIERPVHNNRKFVFVKEDSYEGNMAGITKNNINGLVEVKFIPEDRLYQLRSDNNEFNISCRMNKSMQMNNCMYNNFMQGATVLGNDSRQKFNRASDMIEDNSKVIIRRIRLMIDERLPYENIRTRNTNNETIIYEDEIPQMWY